MQRISVFIAYYGVFICLYSDKYKSINLLTVCLMHALEEGGIGETLGWVELFGLHTWTSVTNGFQCFKILLNKLFNLLLGCIQSALCSFHVSFTNNVVTQTSDIRPCGH